MAVFTKPIPPRCWCGMADPAPGHEHFPETQYDLPRWLLAILENERDAKQAPPSTRPTGAS